MARIAFAARTLLEQIGGDVSCVVGIPDGLGVRRTVMAPASLADALAEDDRVRQAVVVATELGDVTLVEFFADRRGDLAHPFDLG